VIIAARIGEKLKYAVTQAPNVHLLEYELQIKVRPCALDISGHLPSSSSHGP
jgi:hypothetical protein